MTDYKLTTQALIRQIFLAICSSLGFLATGLIRGFSSPGIPSMEETTPWILNSESDKSWITSVPPLGATIGSLVAMPWMHYMGRKRVIQMVGPLFALSWVGIAMSNSTNFLIFFRACTGFGAGVSLPAAQVYVSECSHPRVRGLMASLPSVVMVGGILIQFLFGFVFDWRGMAWASAVFPAVLVVVLLPFPESPPWLKLKGRKGYDEAYKWFGIRSDFEHPQIEEDCTRLNINDNSTRASSTKSFCSRGVLIPLSLAFAMIIFQQSCGNDIVTFNTVMIFRESGSSLDKFIASLTIGAVHFIFVFLSVFLVDKFGRKFLLIFSAIVMGISMGCISTYFYLHKEGKAEHIQFLPLASLITYIASFSLGFCTVPLILVGEIFPLAYRSLLGPLTTSVGLLFMFIELKTYSDLVSHLGLAGAFAIYSFFNFFAVVYTYFLLPETKGKSLEEIEEYFSKRKSDRKPCVIKA